MILLNFANFISINKEYGRRQIENEVVKRQMYWSKTN